MKQQIIADTAATASAGIAATTWITQLNDILQLIATAVAIVAGLGATWWHYERAKQARKERLKENTNGASNRSSR